MVAVKVFFLAMVVALSTDGVFSCMCMTEHPQTDFCNSDYVFRGKIISKTPIYGGRFSNMTISVSYEVMPTHVFRSTGDIVQVDTTVTLTTAGYESTCGVTNMIVDEAYLINAKEISGNIITSLCAWNSVFSDVTPSQKKMLRGRYQNECIQTSPCEVRMHCGAEDIADCGEFDGCTFRTGDCTAEHSYCTKQGDDCTWHHYHKRHRECMSSQANR